MEIVIQDRTGCGAAGRISPSKTRSGSRWSARIQPSRMIESGMPRWRSASTTVPRRKPFAKHSRTLSTSQHGTVLPSTKRPSHRLQSGRGSALAFVTWGLKDRGSCLPARACQRPNRSASRGCPTRRQADFSRNCLAVSSPLDPVLQRDAANDAMGQPDRSDWWMTSYQHLLRGGVPWAKSLKRSWGLGFILRGRGVRRSVLR